MKRIFEDYSFEIALLDERFRRIDSIIDLINRGLNGDNSVDVRSMKKLLHIEVTQVNKTKYPILNFAISRRMKKINKKLRCALELQVSKL